jgi:hypothetical protein
MFVQKEKLRRIWRFGDVRIKRRHVPRHEKDLQLERQQGQQLRGNEKQKPDEKHSTIMYIKNKSEIL